MSAVRETVKMLKTKCFETALQHWLPKAHLMKIFAKSNIPNKALEIYALLSEKAFNDVANTAPIGHHINNQIMYQIYCGAKQRSFSAKH